MGPSTPLSLRLRLTLLTGLLTGGTLLLFALVFYLVLRGSLHREIDARLRERAALLSRAVAASGSAGSAPSLPAPAPVVEFASPGIYAELIAPDGTVRAASANLPPGQLPAALAVLSGARAGQATSGTATVGGAEQLRLLAVPVSHPPGSVLLVAESLEPVERTLQRARSLLLAGGGLGLALALGGTTLLTGRALGPIGRLTQTAAEIAATGEYRMRVPRPPRYDEVGRLAATINDLIATVERTLEQQRQFVADTSHELRSPLTVVLANLDLLRRDLDAPDRELSLGEATAEAQRMRRLVNDLLLLAQADAREAIAYAPVRLDRLIEETVAMAARQTPEHNLRAYVDAPVVVAGDEERLRQLLRNLLENATRHTLPGTTVTVRLRRTSELAQLVVADTGPGIRQAHLPHIWDRFYRVDKARSRAAGGTGLGLAIVKYIAEAHGGSASVTSEEGKGTTFTIVLPLALDDRWNGGPTAARRGEAARQMGLDRR